jgi:hypothetical protein
VQFVLVVLHRLRVVLVIFSAAEWPEQRAVCGCCWAVSPGGTAHRSHKLGRGSSGEAQSWQLNQQQQQQLLPLAQKQPPRPPLAAVRTFDTIHVWHGHPLAVLQPGRVHPAANVAAANLLPQTPSTPVEVRLSLDTFEKAINMLELMHFDAVKAWWEEQQSGEQQQTCAVIIVACTGPTVETSHIIKADSGCHDPCNACVVVSSASSSSWQAVA